MSLLTFLTDDSLGNSVPGLGGFILSVYAFEPATVVCVAVTCPLPSFYKYRPSPYLLSNKALKTYFPLLLVHNIIFYVGRLLL